MWNLRDYQQQVINDTYNLIRQGEKKILLFAPTGAGKTVIATKIVLDIISRNKRVLFVVHRDILVGQTHQKFAAAGIDCGFVKAGWPEDLSAPVQIASCQTLATREDWQTSSFDVLIYDECHLVAFSKICLALTKQYPQAIFLGLTATPWRLSKRESLGDIYTQLVTAPMPWELIEQGHLTKPSYYGLIFNVDLEELELDRGDYNQRQLSMVCDRPELIEQLCDAWFDLAYQRPTIVFTVGIVHAKNIVAAFKLRGVSAALVEGKTPITKRNQLYAQLSSGELQILASCGALSEGFDVPVVSCVILARPTKSKALYFQQLGRGLRLAQDKRDCLILDQSQNVLHHGFIEDLKDVELVPSDRTSSKKTAPAPLKVCPQEDGGCGLYVYSIYQKCPHCDYSFELKKLVSVIGKSHLLTQGDEEKLAYYRSQLREAYDKSFAPSWAALNFKTKYAFFPPYDWARGALFDFQNPIVQYQQHLERIAQRLNKDQEWVEKYLYLEFGSIKDKL